ncbi:hypothetical protein BDV29DRAFT_196345 [Aspergillus leporis]|uniref:Zn(2)-C6 fungal-type domain-containing protein n=1 Tax=Aspergillus leporis TaxID=41062 RepID=A0A5N5WGT0_9EURO|nr:hypothetical protein BDV29DRAFT_196345 [Aspergillus leporis]
METVMLGSEKRRRRPAVSCTLCRRRKIRCNRESPCSNCLRSRSGTCDYENPNLPSSPRRHSGQRLTAESRDSVPIGRSSSTSPFPSHPPSSLATSLTSPSTPTSQYSAEDAELTRLKLRIRELEKQLTNATLRPLAPDYDIETTSSRVSGTFHVHCKRNTSGQLEPIPHSVSLKTRLFGQSHWSVSAVYLVRDTFNTLEPHLRGDSSNAWIGLEKCKSLARSIKAWRSPSWPALPTSNLPPREVADTLVDNYLRTTEAIYRILHVPTFRRDYEALWVSNAEPDLAFLVELKLMLALGAVTYDDHFSLRTSAIRWVYEAQIWVAEPKFKLRLNIQSLQIHLLLLFAQERVGVGGDLTWVSAGALLRRAMYMGLHRDPSFLPRRTAFAAEMRRRLWNTILEVNLQSSLSSGGTPLISLGDFDTAPPGNFDDEQLEVQDPVPKVGFTQVSIAIVLRKTFPQRLAVVKFLNDLASPGTYEETLKLDAELRAAYRALGQSLRALGSLDLYAEPLPSHYEIHVVDFLMHRYLLSLHVPYFGPGQHGKAYTFSRKSVIESSLKLWRTACPSLSLVSVQLISDAVPSASNDLQRLVACSSGFYPTVAIHAAFLIAVELRMQLQEEDSLCPAPLRPDLLSVLDDAKAWCLRVIEAGETNVKGYLLLSLVTAQVEGLVRGFREEQVAEVLIKAVEDVEYTCLPKLEKMAALAQGQRMGGEHELQHATPVDLDEDWGFMTSDTLFDPGDTEPMSWLFNDDLNQVVSLL